jgi:hypothetical protein
MDETTAWRERFMEEVHRRGLHVGQPLPDGRVALVLEDRELVVRLDNLFRSLRRNAAPDTVSRFLDGILESQQPLPAWPDARAQVRFCAAQPPEEETDVIAVPVTDRLISVVCWVDAQEERVRFVGENQLAIWGVEDEELLLTASYNMGRMLEAVPLEVHRRKGVRVGVLETTSPFKASLVFAPNLRTKLEPSLGWPVVAAIPCRDFVFLFGAGDLDAIKEEIGGVVLKEFRESSYPLTTELLHISEQGVTAVGHFDPPPEG